MSEGGAAEAIANMVRLTFKAQDGATWVVEAEEGVSVMSVAVAHRVPVILGACGGSQACGTCHAYVAEPWFSGLPPRGVIEQEMLDFALHPEPNSRLTCQVVVTRALDGAVITLPPE